MLARVFAIVACLILIGDTEGVYENNPFLNGNYKPAVLPPSNGEEKPVMVASPQIPQINRSSDDLREYCLGPRGYYQSGYCNTFVGCWEELVVEFICPTPLLFSPQGYCDFPEKVDCAGKPIKLGSSFQPINDGSYVPQPAPPVVQVPAYSPSGWPSDGSYRPPPVAVDGSYRPPQNQGDDGSYKPGQGGWDDGSYKPQSSTNSPPVPPVVVQQPTVVPPVQAPTYPPTNAPPIWIPAPDVTTEGPIAFPQVPSNKYCKTKRGQYPGSTCNKYVNCWDNVVVELECPEGLNFNPYKGYCDYHWNYDCKQTGGEIPSDIIRPPVPPTQSPIIPPSTQPPVVSSSTQPPSIISQPALDNFCKDRRGQFPGSACNKYVNCWDGIAIEQECPEGFNFNANKGYCDFPWNYFCEGAGGAPAGIPPTTSAPVSSVPSETVPAGENHLLKYCLKPRGQFPGTSCEKYVNCWDGYVVEQECPTGLTFNVAKNYCDYGGESNCKKSEQAGDSSVETRGECPIVQGTFRKKNDCVNYFTCIGKKVVAQYACPKGYLYNDVIGVCDIQDRVDCSKDPFIYYPKFKTTGNLLPPAVIDPSLPCESGTIFRLNENCSHVAICRNGLTEIVQCPQGLKYDLAKDSCLEPHLAKC